jgi:hypothetical protein
MISLGTAAISPATLEQAVEESVAEALDDRQEA